MNMYVALGASSCDDMGTIEVVENFSNIFDTLKSSGEDVLYNVPKGTGSESQREYLKNKIFHIETSALLNYNYERKLYPNKIHLCMYVNI